MRGPSRSADTLVNDSARVGYQIAKIDNAKGNNEFQLGLLQKIVAGRAADHTAYQVGAIEHPDGFLVAVVGEVLVLAKDSAAAWAALGSEGFAAGVAVPELGNRVVRFTHPDGTVQAAESAVDMLTQQGITASVNYVMPLGYVAKGEGGFEPTTVDAGYRGPGAVKGTGVRVAVIDTGVAYQNRDDGWLENVPRDGANQDTLYRNKPTLDFAAGHGTFVAGIIQQVAPKAQIVMYKAIQSDGVGSDLEVAKMIVKAAQEGAKVINLSLGSGSAEHVQPVATMVALQMLDDTHPDVLLVASAGNSASSEPTWPAAFPDVVAVASLRADSQPSEWSNRGPWVDCATVGEGVVSPYVVGKESKLVDKDGPDTFTKPSWAIGSGTSFAAPQVTGMIAALMEEKGCDAHDARDQLLSVQYGTMPDADYGWRLKILDGTAR